MSKVLIATATVTLLVVAGVLVHFQLRDNSSRGSGQEQKNTLSSLLRTGAGSFHHHHHHKNGDGCSQYTDCASCTNSPTGECGFCLATGVCQSGTNAGPTKTACPVGEWSWYATDCLDCYPYASGGCASCIAEAGCGWCGNEGGVGEGSCRNSNSSCTATYTQGSNATCPASYDCSQYTDCGSCTNSIGGCGYCVSTKTCSKGSSTGPAQGGCMKGDWEWSTAQCPTTYDCSQYTTCDTCTNSPLGQCGFCPSTKTCSKGTKAGPSQGSCPTWEWDQSKCPANTNCGQYTTCGSCTADSSGQCGFCSTSKTCLEGTSSGPTTYSCKGTWEWTHSSCPAA